MFSQEKCGRVRVRARACVYVPVFSSLKAGHALQLYEAAMKCTYFSKCSWINLYLLILLYNVPYIIQHVCSAVKAIAFNFLFINYYTNTVRVFMLADD